MPARLATPPSVGRSAIVTAVGWLVVVASAVLSLVSAAALLMLAAGGDGTQSTTFLGFLSVVVAPPASLVAGFAFLRRRAWAHYYLVALFGVLLATSLFDFWRANPEPVHYVSPSGVPTTVLPTDRTMFVPMIVVSIGMLAVLLSRRVRLEFAGAESRPATVAPVQPTPVAPRDSRNWSVPTRRESRLAALAAVLILLAMAGGTSWLAYEGISTGTTTLPSKSSLQRRPVSRADEPILFWFSNAFYVSIAVGCVGLVGWGAAQMRR